MIQAYKDQNPISPSIALSSECKHNHILTFPYLLMAEKQLKIKGSVERITFHNEDNGFCILKLKPENQKQLVTVVGKLPRIQEAAKLFGLVFQISDDFLDTHDDKQRSSEELSPNYVLNNGKHNLK